MSALDAARGSAPIASTERRPPGFGVVYAGLASSGAKPPFPPASTTVPSSGSISSYAATTPLQNARNAVPLTLPANPALLPLRQVSTQDTRHSSVKKLGRFVSSSPVPQRQLSASDGFQTTASQQGVSSAVRQTPWTPQMPRMAMQVSQPALPPTAGSFLAPTGSSVNSAMVRMESMALRASSPLPSRSIVPAVVVPKTESKPTQPCTPQANSFSQSCSPQAAKQPCPSQGGSFVVPINPMASVVPAKPMPSLVPAKSTAGSFAVPSFPAKILSETRVPGIASKVPVTDMGKSSSPAPSARGPKQRFYQPGTTSGSKTTLPTPSPREANDKFPQSGALSYPPAFTARDQQQHFLQGGAASASVPIMTSAATSPSTQPVSSARNPKDPIFQVSGVSVSVPMMSSVISSPTAQHAFSARDADPFLQVGGSSVSTPIMTTVVASSPGPSARGLNERLPMPMMSATSMSSVPLMITEFASLPTLPSYPTMDTTDPLPQIPSTGDALCNGSLNDRSFQVGTTTTIVSTGPLMSATPVVSGSLVVDGSAAPGPPTLSTIDPKDPFLQAGATVQIQNIVYYVHQPLGMGSFGAVWSASRCDGGGGEVAIKEILCRSSKELEDATLEARLLQLIHESNPQQLSRKVPDLVGKEAQCLGPDMWIMRLAMTKVPGMQLDVMVDMCRKPTLKSSDSDRARACAIIAAQCCSLTGAAKFARSLLSQLAAIFASMASVVYHRDVSPHNVLIDVSDPHNPSFGLVDFGLGIDLPSWLGPKGTASWHYADIGGDCRYWPISVWLMFVGGCRELEKRPALAREYKERLDFHAVGITVLEVLMSFLPNMGSFDSEAIQPLRTAWANYWQDVNHFWKQTMAVFDSGTDPSELKRWISMEGQVPQLLGVHLTAIRVALRKAAKICSTTGPADAARVFLALLELVSNAGCDPLQTPGWPAVRAIIDGSQAPVPTAASAAPGSMVVPSMSAIFGATMPYNQAALPGSLLVSSAAPKSHNTLMASSPYITAPHLPMARNCSAARFVKGPVN